MEETVEVTVTEFQEWIKLLKEIRTDLDVIKDELRKKGNPDEVVYIG